MSLVALSATHRPSPLLAARRARRAGASSSTSSLGDVASNRRRSSSSRLRATGEVTPDGVLEVAPEGLPVEPSEPPTPAQTSASAPLACPVSLTLLDVRGASRESGLQYAVTDGVWDLTLGAAVNVSEAATPSISDLARSFLPRELRGLIPTSSYLGTSTFETPQVAFAYERGWRDSFKRADSPARTRSSPSRAPNSSHTRAEKCSWTPRAAVASSPADSPRAASTDASSRWIFLTPCSARRASSPSTKAFSRRERPATTSCSSARTSRDFLSPREAWRASTPGRPFTVGRSRDPPSRRCARVLEPGAAFCGTTFLTPKIPFADDATQQAVDAAVREVSDALAGRVGGPRGFRQWNKRDLEELCVACGLVDFECDVRDGFIFYAAKKPVAFTGTDA